MSLAIFDLDGTLINGQSQEYLIFYLYKKKLLSLYKLFIIFSWFLGYRLNIFNNPSWPLNFVFSTINGKNTEKVEKLMDNFYREVLSYKFNKNIVEKLKEHQKKGNKIILLSNAVEPIIKIVAKKLKIKHYISTELEVEDNIYTGNIKGSIVYGDEKIKKVMKKISKNDLQTAFVYADHYSDLNLLNAVNNPVLVYPSRKTLNFLKKYKNINKIKIINKRNI